VLFLIGGVLTAKHVLMPPAKVTAVATASDGKFKQLPDLAALREEVAQANQQGKIAMVDLYADWCVACKEFEKYTFSDDKVKQAFKDFSLLKLDLTVTNEVSKEIYQTFNVVGLPAILFFDAQGNELSNLRITGFQSAEEFTSHLEKVRQTVQ
jgi:thiol:disulfide interchange protein DsbD